MQFIARKKRLQVNPLNDSHSSSTSLTHTLRMNRLRREQHISIMRVAAKIGFTAAGIMSGKQRQAIRKILLDNYSLVYGFTRIDRQSVFSKMLNKLNKVEGLESGAKRQFLDRFMQSLIQLRSEITA